MQCAKGWLVSWAAAWGLAASLVISEPPTELVSIPCTMDDFIWQTIDSTRTDREYVFEIADRFLTTDGKAGAIRDSLAAGGWPILVTHWQSLFPNGLETGIAVLDEVGRRMQTLLADEVVWCSAPEAMERTIAQAER